MNIPTVDLEDLVSADPAALARGATALREAFGTYGLVYIRNHPVDLAALERFYDAFRAFVARPEEPEQQRGRGSLPGQIRHKGSFNRFRGRR